MPVSLPLLINLGGEWRVSRSIESVRRGIGLVASMRFQCSAPVPFFLLGFGSLDEMVKQRFYGRNPGTIDKWRLREASEMNSSPIHFPQATTRGPDEASATDVTWECQPVFAQRGIFGVEWVE